MDVNTCIFTGNATSEPKVKISQSGTEYVMFSIGTNQRAYDPSTNSYQNDSQFVDFIAFGEQADIIKKSVHRGTKVYIESMLQQTKYRDQSGKIRRWMIFKVTDIDIREGERTEKWHSPDWI